MHWIDKLIASLDNYMEQHDKRSITPSEANEYLSSIGLLANYDRSGNELRRLCRNGFLWTARQPGGKNTKWVIYHSKNKSYSLSEKLENIVQFGKGEREICSFLAKHPAILRWAVCRTGGHGTWVLKEYPLGSKYKVDFVVITCYSGKWEIHLIELEPHDDNVITKKGTPSVRLAGAIAQINDWKEYILQNPVPFRQDLADWCMKKDILSVSPKRSVPVNGTNQYLKAPDTYLDINYYIVIGNRNRINEEQHRKINQIQYSNKDLEIFSYGRFVDLAKNEDKYHYGEENVVMTYTEDNK